MYHWPSLLIYIVHTKPWCGSHSSLFLLSKNSSTDCSRLPGKNLHSIIFDSRFLYELWSPFIFSSKSICELGSKDFDKINLIEFRCIASRCKDFRRKFYSNIKKDFMKKVADYLERSSFGTLGCVTKNIYTE